MAASSAVIDGIAASALRSVLQRVQQVAEQCGRESQRICAVAVSKTKPVSLVRQVYDTGHRCFDENYVQELVEKAPQLSDDIEWHFIGNLQSNKLKPLIAAVPNLAMVETVDDEKITNHLNRAVGNFESLSPAKSGVEPSGCVELAKHVSLNCPNLQFCGLMTIGMPDYTSTPENFKTLTNCRSEVCKALGIPEEQCELSMRMSGDFELAHEEVVAISKLPADVGDENGETIIHERSIRIKPLPKKTIPKPVQASSELPILIRDAKNDGEKTAQARGGWNFAKMLGFGDLGGPPLSAAEELTSLQIPR
ncbi:Tetratricopeptide repeat-like superfamily protein [Hibiscus syriacus]|uniref:Tetratricopeptide repeat-like superfamily protein n=1 Tax=Hibiscus syriacus TaxID=106335 RepID=A0A6A2YUN5_HIBSY|nr:Tetratricopeptide repeat-like superfamily protein [Hibiscus syriacus]